MRAARRAGSTAVLVLVLLLSTGSPAWAHAGGLSPAEARSVVSSVAPDLPGLAVTTIETGARLAVRNDTAVTVEVPPGDGQTDAVDVPPGGYRTWIDGRATNLGRSLDGAATATWSVPMLVGGVEVTVTGQFIAEPAPMPLGWWVAAAALALAVVAVARRLRRPDLVLLVAGTAAVVASLGHVVGATMAVRSGPPVGTFLDAMGIGLLVWPMVAIGVVAVLRGRPLGTLALCAGAALTVLFVLPDVTVFHYPVLPFAGPADLERLLVATALGAGTGAAVAGSGALRALADRERTATTTGSPSS